MGIGAAIGAVATIGSAVIGSHAAGKAADAQTNAANQAAATQMAMYQQTRSDLGPFMAGGGQAFSNLANIFGFTPQSPAAGTTATTGATGTTAPAATPTTSPLGAPSVTAPGIAGGASQTYTLDSSGNLVPTTAPAPGTGTNGLPSTLPVPTNGTVGTPGVPNSDAAWQSLTKFPGYQFGLNQGIEALDRSAASRGLLLSGAQLKDAQQYGVNYAADKAWQPYVSELNYASSLGESAAAGVGNAGATAAGNIGQSQLAAGQAQAAGAISQGNILSTGIDKLASSYGNIGGIGGGSGFNAGAAISSGNDALNSIPVMTPFS